MTNGMYGCLVRPATGEIIDAGWIVVTPQESTRVFHDRADEADVVEYHVDQGFRHIGILPAWFSVN